MVVMMQKLFQLRLCLGFRLAAALLALGSASGAVLAQQAAAPSATGAEVFVQTGNSLMVTMARFSPDGQRLVTCDGTGLAVGWDATSGRQYREVHRHNGTCLGLDFTPDGERVVSSGGAGRGNEVVMSRWVDGAPLQSWEGYAGQVVGLAATRDGQGAWALGDRRVLLRWALGNAAPAQSISLLLPGENADSAPNNTTMVLSRDQTHAYIGRYGGSILSVGLSPVTAPVLLATLPESVSALALSPDGKLLAASQGTIMGSSGKEVVLLDTASGQQTRRLIGHAGNVFALAFSPDGLLLASAAQIDTATLLNGPFSAIRDQEALRLWRVQDGSLVADVRNQRNRNGSPFLRGSLDFVQSASAQPGESGLRLALALWDEAARIYEVDAAGSVAVDARAPATPDTKRVRLLYTLEGRGLPARQLKASDASARLMVADARPRIEPRESYLSAADIRREFGKESDWNEERSQRIATLYSGKGFLTKVQKASLWNLKTGRLEQVLDWQRGDTSELGLDAQGRFTSVAPLFPQTIMIAPLKTRMVREATADAQGQMSWRHYSYEPWDGKPDDIFIPIPAAGTPTAAPPPADLPAHAGAYGTEVITQSPSQRWTVIAGVPIQSPGAAATSKLSPRVFVQERLADGAQVSRHDIGMPGRVRAMAVSADERTLWVSGTAKGLPYNSEHEAWLLAINLADGAIVRQWALAPGITVDVIAAHPAGDMAITNGGTNLSVWDRRQAERKYFVKASLELRPLRGLGMSADARSIAASDTTGWTGMWDWPDGAEPRPRWARQLASPAPHLITFLAANQRIAAAASDGSVRLLSSQDGAEVARMIRFDNDEWITITPEGYFVASQDGDRLVNVRMNGKVYGIDQFYDVFYRPDIVERRLAGKTLGLISVTLQDALNEPPPKVTLALPANAAPAAGGKYRIDVQALAQGGGVGELRVMHNGKLVEVLNRAVVTSGLADQRAALQPAPTLAQQAANPAMAEAVVTRGLQLAAEARADPASRAAPLQKLQGSIEVELVPGDNAFTVIGFNGSGNLNARPITRQITATGTLPAPRVFVLAVGINNFASPNARALTGAVKDSTDFANTLRGKLGGAYANAPVIVRLLHDGQATRAGLDAALAQLAREVLAGDMLVWFVASHGTLDTTQEGVYGIVLQDWDGRAREASLFSSGDILEASRRIKAFNQLVILDTCHAGGVNTLVSGLYDARLSVLARNMGLHLFASAADTQEAIDSYEGNGLFTHTLLKGLRTRAADKDGDRQISINELGDYARSETSRIARGTGHSQVPLLMNIGKDVPLYGTQ
jgi:WD40 repeat protein